MGLTCQLTSENATFDRVLECHVCGSVMEDVVGGNYETIRREV